MAVALNSVCAAIQLASCRTPIAEASGSGATIAPVSYTHLDVYKRQLQGKRFGVPQFILEGSGIPFHGLPAAVPDEAANQLETEQAIALQPATRAAFMKAIDELRAAGATVVFDDSILPASFAKTASRVSTYAYVREGTDKFLNLFGPAQYLSLIHI